MAVDAVNCELKVALRERDSLVLIHLFTSCPPPRTYFSPTGKSSKSTKPIHGGVRYLQKAVLELDYDRYKLVKDALQ